jgi:DNA-binding beta-propeller fold protein YncE
VSHPRISVFAGSANGSAVAKRTIEGQATLQARTDHQIAIDSIHDEVVAPNPFAQAILFFRGGASGEEAPIRIIQGPKTQLAYVDNVAVDPVHNEVVAAQTLTDAVLVFDREQGGNVAPIRILHGPHTKLEQPWKASVDPVNNLIVVTTKTSILFFDRTADGDAAPKWAIEGPKLRAMSPRILTPAVYPAGKKVFVTMRVKKAGDVAIGVWNYGDDGDVPPWGVIKSSKTTRLNVLTNGGMAINPAAKEVMALAGDEYGSERVLIFKTPELFR